VRLEIGMTGPLRQHHGDFPRRSRYLTIRTHRRTRHFHSSAVVARTLMEFLRLARLEGFAILAYCFMPDHLHLLIEATRERADLGTFVRLAKQHSGRTHVNTYGTLLWQEGFDQRALGVQEDVRSIARYILHNPVRTGMVRTPGDYPFLGSSKWPLEDLLRRASP
jgi:putative transposase